MDEILISFRVDPWDPLWGLRPGAVAEVGDHASRVCQTQVGPMRLLRTLVLDESRHVVYQTWKSVTAQECAHLQVAISQS